MKVNEKGPADVVLSDLIRSQDTRATDPRQGPRERGEAEDATRVSISKDGERLQRVVSLAHEGDGLRADKVKLVKEAVEQGTYRPDAQEVARSTIKAEVSRLLTGAPRATREP